MKTVELTVYEFNELSEKAQKNAIENIRHRVLVSQDFEVQAETLLDDFKSSAAELGIEIHNIYYSGFAHQGDGAQFTGVYRYRKGWRQAIREQAGGDLLKSLEAIGDQLQAIQKTHFYALEAFIETKGNDCHEYATNIDIEAPDYYFDISENTQDQLEEALRDFMRFMYRTLEEEFFWFISDERIKEDIEINESEFDEDGNPV